MVFVCAYLLSLEIWVQRWLLWIKAHVLWILLGAIALAIGGCTCGNVEKLCTSIWVLARFTWQKVDLLLTCIGHLHISEQVNSLIGLHILSNLCFTIIPYMSFAILSAMLFCVYIQLLYRNSNEWFLLLIVRQIGRSATPQSKIFRLRLLSKRSVRRLALGFDQEFLRILICFDLSLLMLLVC